MASITKQDVINAIQQLQDQGVTATNQAILEITGGSNATVQKYRKEYFDSITAQAVKESIVLKESEASTLTAAFAALLKSRIDGVKAEYEAVLDQLNAALQETSTHNDQLLLNVETLQNDLVKSQAEIQQQAGLLEGLRTELSEAKREAANQVAEARNDTLREREGAEAARQALARAELRLEAVPALEKHLEDMRGELNTERKARTDAEKISAVAAAEKAALSSTADDLRTRLQSTEQRLAAMASEVDKRQGEKVDLELKVTELRTNLDATKNALEAAENRERELVAQLKPAAKKPGAQ